MSTDKDVEQSEPSYTVDGNATCCSHFGEKSGNSSYP